MNERIKQLAEQAGYDIGPFYTGEDNYQIPHYKDEKLEKFAELIVAECIETLRLVPYNSDREFGDEAIYQEAITEHFGVEE